MLSSAATEPSTPGSWLPAASSAALPSLRVRPTASASARAAQVERSRSASRSASASSRARASVASQAATAASCCASRPSSPASRAPTSSLHLRELRLGLRGAVAGIAGRGRVRRAISSWPAAARRAQRVDLTGELGEALAAVGDRAHGRDQRTLGGGELRFELLPGADGVGQLGVCGVEVGLERGLLAAHLGGLGLQGLGITTDPHLVGLTGQVPGAFGGQRRGPAEALLERGQPVPGLLRRATRGASAASCARARPRGRAPACRACSTSVAAGPDRLLVGDLAVELGAQLEQVVGEQPQPRVAQLGLHPGGPAGDLGLLAERLELAPQLVGEVGDAGQVGLHRVELAQRLLLALAVFQDARPLPR